MVNVFATPEAVELTVAVLAVVFALEASSCQTRMLCPAADATKLPLVPVAEATFAGK